MARASGHPIRDHREIRKWAEERGAKPTCVRNTGDDQDVGMIRLDSRVTAGRTRCRKSAGTTGSGSSMKVTWFYWSRIKPQAVSKVT